MRRRCLSIFLDRFPFFLFDTYFFKMIMRCVVVNKYTNYFVLINYVFSVDFDYPMQYVAFLSKTCFENYEIVLHFFLKKSDELVAGAYCSLKEKKIHHYLA